jgi:hypothetical protein
MSALALLLSIPTSLLAQSVGRYLSRFDWGFGLNFLNMNDDTYIVNLAMPAAQIGFNLPYHHLAENVALGVSAGLTLAATNGTGIGGDESTLFSTINVPAFATVKYNTDASWKGTDGFGVGLAGGIGYQLTYFLPLGVSMESIFFGLPTYMVELNFGKRTSFPGLIKLRYTGNIGEHKETFSSDPADFINFSQSAFYILFTKNY